MLVSLLFGTLMLMPTAMPAEDPPAPLFVQAAASGEMALVTWTPPVMSPDDLGAISYLVYGYTDGTAVHLTTEANYNTSTLVEGGYETYAVSVMLGGVESQRVKACITIDTTLPFIHRHC